ncbi:MAG: hypothetical protein D6679_05090 [Candidatus Hydrogenedentota bacterium]|nr:MAG: hypothetical protein D6679_05090 [Candidatus Hydrogenedentota bacterium]
MVRLFSFLLVLFLSATLAAAAPMGAIRPRIGQFSGGLTLGYDRRKMHSIGNRLDFRRAKNKYLLAEGSFSVSESILVKGSVGFDNFTLVDYPDVNTVQTAFAGGTEFAFGAGAGIIVYESALWNLALNGNVLAHIQHEGDWPNGPGSPANADYIEWSGGVQVQGRYRDITPYVGVRLSTARISYNNPGGLADDETDQKLGVYGGGEFSLSPEWSVFLEGRFSDEMGVSAGTAYHF